MISQPGCPCSSIIAHAFNPIAELHVTAITCQPSHHVKYRNHTQIPKNHPLDREKTPNSVEEVDAASYLEALCRDLIESVQKENGTSIALKTDIDSEPLPVDRAIPLGLMDRL